MRWTGLAIRDAVTIERARFQQNSDGVLEAPSVPSEDRAPGICDYQD